MHENTQYPIQKYPRTIAGPGGGGGLDLPGIYIRRQFQRPGIVDNQSRGSNRETESRIWKRKVSHRILSENITSQTDLYNTLFTPKSI